MRYTAKRITAEEFFAQGGVLKKKVRRTNCGYLGEPQTNSVGEYVKIKVECGTSENDGKFVAAHVCSHPEKQKANGKAVLCLPHYKPCPDSSWFSEDRIPERVMYHVCELCPQRCPVKPGKPSSAQ